VHGVVSAGEASLEHLTVAGRLRTEKVPELGRRISPLSDARALFRLVALTLRESPDVIHTHTAKAGTLGRIAAFVFNATRRRRSRCIVVHTFHGHVLTGYFHPAISAGIRVVERALGSITDRIITISALQRREIVERFRITTAAKAALIPLGLDLQELLELPAGGPTYRSALAIPGDAIVVGYVGRMVPIKDLRTLVKAFGLALAKQPNLWLVLAGDGPIREDLQALADRSGIAHRVRFLGWTEDLARTYATLDICALSSLNEGTPVAAIEAMAAGKAVASTAVGGVPDVIENGVTGLLVPPGSHEALAEALVLLATDPKERRRLGEAARLSVASRYAPQRLVEEIERLYISALREKRG
jgi:glycosyltransferase involved in cell wall biosynthesis